jgi:hypothetical protein
VLLAFVGSAVFAQEPPAKLPAPPPVLKVYTAESAAVVPEPPVWTSDQTPADFLEKVSGRLKVRWRQHYRDPAPVPSNERVRGAFVLGSLLADSFIALQASDAQQFKNTNQDVLNYTRTLGLSDKLSPRLMSQGKLAETETWAELRQQVVDGHMELNRLLHEQRDDDLAVFVDLGLWLRLLQVVTTVVTETDEAAKFPLCIGSPKLLAELQTRWGSLPAEARAIDQIDKIGHTLDYLTKQWQPDGTPDKALVTKTREKLADLLTRITSR